MVDEHNDFSQDKPAIAQGRNSKTDVNLFPALTERRGSTITAMRPAPSRIGTQISLFTPTSFEEALDIVECLRGRAATTISLENLKKLDASRLVDFVAGASAALDGDFHKLSEQVYIFCPSNIKITVPGKPLASGASTAFNSPDLDFLYPSSTGLDSSATASTWSTIQ
ncbi:MAG TPA: cell division protein SepF [Chroococcales cyanobacterium]